MTVRVEALERELSGICVRGTIYTALFRVCIVYDDFPLCVLL